MIGAHRQLEPGRNGLYLGTQGAWVFLEDCRRRGKYFRACGAPATHVLRVIYSAELRGGRQLRRVHQLCEAHAREAAARWRIRFPETSDSE